MLEPSTPRLADNFIFSQTSLQDWLTCQRRFRYLYLDKLAYPAPETADQIAFEQHMAQGDAFHRCVHQHQVGIPADVIAARIDDEQVHEWWRHYLAHGTDGLPPNRYAEVTLMAPLGDYRLIAKYDLIALQPGERAVIVDWKTGTNRPTAASLAQRMQTVVYRYLLVQGGTYYNGGVPIPPGQVEMTYWFASAPTQPIRIPYDEQQHKHDADLLPRLVAQIAAEQAFPKVQETEKDRVCRFCNFRSLCWDDVSAGAFVEMLTLDEATDDAPTHFEIDLDQIAEIEF